MLNVRTIELVGESCMIVRLSGKHNSGDMINFSFSFFNKLVKLKSGAGLLIDIRGAELKLMKGLFQAASEEFFKAIQNNRIRRIAAVVDLKMYEIIKDYKTPSYVRLFNEEYDAAMQWLKE